MPEGNLHTNMDLTVFHHEVFSFFWSGIGQFLMNIILPYPFGNSVFRTYSILVGQIQGGDSSCHIFFNDSAFEFSRVSAKHAVAANQSRFSIRYICRKPMSYHSKREIIVLFKLVKGDAILCMFLQ